MALRRFGYGSWDAPYWFLGPEEGMDLAEDPKCRLAARHQLGKTDLTDCRAFHKLIGQEKYFSKDPVPVATWSRLILLLLETLDLPAGDDEIRSYQRDHWGESGGRVCVAELSGLAAPSMAVGKLQLQALFTQKEIEALRMQRLKAIRQRMHECNPALVVTYTLAEQHDWEVLAGGQFHEKRIDGHRFGLRQWKSTIVVLAPHPTGTKGLKKDYWPKAALEIGRFSVKCSLHLPALA
jgi:hypothetical protein